MIDWFVLLTPLVLLPIALLFLFVGCGFDGVGTKPPDPPPPPPPPPPPGTTPPPPKSGKVISGATGAIFALGKPTRLQLNPSVDINVIKPGGTNFKVTRIEVEWTLSNASGQVKVPATPPLTPKGGRVFLDPALDGSAMEDLAGVTAARYDGGQLTCRVVVTTRDARNVANPQTAVQPATPPLTISPFVPEKVYVFELQPDWVPLIARPRKFKLIQKF